MKHLSAIFKSQRLWGLTGTAVVLYFLLFVVLGKLDMSWIMPDTNQIAQTLIEVWPRMPFFAVRQAPSRDGKGTEIYYTVPTRQFTPKEIAQMETTNRVARPVPPPNSGAR